MEFTLEHYVIIGFSFAIGFLLAFVFIRINYARNLTKLETSVEISDQRQVTLENQLLAKEIELNSIRKQTVDLMQNEAELKNKAKTEQKVLKGKEALLESMRMKILSSFPTGTAPVALTSSTSLKETISPTSFDNSSLQRMDQKLSSLLSNANTKLDKIAVAQTSLSKDTATLLQQASQGVDSLNTVDLDIESMKKASEVLEKAVFSESEEFIETSV